MYYVEFLRVMRMLRLVGYVLGAVLLLALVFRPFSHGSINVNNSIEGVDPSTIPAHTNADGSTTRSFMGKHGRHVTIVARPDKTETITVDDPAYNGKKGGNEHIEFGHLKVSTSNGGRHRVSTIDTDLKIPLNILLVIAACVAAIVATLLGLALSRENDGHLELAWTKPASRESYALASVAVDSLGILGVMLATLVTIVLVLAIYGGASYITVSDSLTSLLFGMLFALSFYGIVLAATSSMRRGGLVLSLLWPAALILPGLVRVQWMNLGTVARTLNTINPVAYLYAFLSSPQTTNIFTLLPNYGTAAQVLAVLLLFVAGVALSLAQWRRLEA
ncbi:MAG: hypothetical protein GIW97_03200 [Candidatus Eremiobacteraeota bacterium]|nr:hypothetical protein [Candidatus Eremiobacteraeota bacterium]